MSHLFLDDYPGGSRSEKIPHNPQTSLYVERSTCRCGACRKRLKDDEAYTRQCPSPTCNVDWDRIVILRDRRTLPAGLPNLPAVSEAAIREPGKYPEQSARLGARTIEIAILTDDHYL